MSDKDKIQLAIGFIKTTRDSELSNAHNGDEYADIEDSYSNILEQLEL